ncbi:hypothetical protein EI94DRAFT_1706415 [Lactarius quietus]|nr:hypothetical protein EI94DRAFT_1706415 [Lactarius quietus]
MSRRVARKLCHLTDADSVWVRTTVTGSELSGALYAFGKSGTYPSGDRLSVSLNYTAVLYISWMSSVSASAGCNSSTPKKPSCWLNTYLTWAADEEKWLSWKRNTVTRRQLGKESQKKYKLQRSTPELFILKPLSTIVLTRSTIGPGRKISTIGDSRDQVMVVSAWLATRWPHLRCQYTYAPYVRYYV